MMFIMGKLMIIYFGYFDDIDNNVNHDDNNVNHDDNW